MKAGAAFGGGGSGDGAAFSGGAASDGFAAFGGGGYKLNGGVGGAFGCSIADIGTASAGGAFGGSSTGGGSGFGSGDVGGASAGAFGCGGAFGGICSVSAALCTAVCRRHYKSCSTRGWDAPLAIPLRLTESNTPNLRCCLWSASLMSVVTTDLLVRNLRQLRRHWQESERRLAGSHLRAESPLGEVAKESPYPFLIAPA